MIPPTWAGRDLTGGCAGPDRRLTRGPKTPWSDAEVVTGIQAVLAASAFHGESYRTIRARLAHRGLAVSGKRVLRLCRQTAS